MSRNTSSKQSGPTTRFGRLIVYDRETVISICRRLFLGEDLDTICAKTPMPIAGVFLAWIQDHPEARAIYRSAQNFECDCRLAKEQGIPMDCHVGEWEYRVRANCERGWPADYMERKYIPPDWSKVYPLVGGPPVWSTEDIEAYTELLNGFTEMLEPRDLMELIWTKEAADATWEAARMAREKNCLPERKYQQRLQVVAEVQRRTGAAEITAAKAASTLDHSRGLEAGFKPYQGQDIAQSRALKRRDNALRQIARWRDGLGAKARHLSDKFIAEQALAERYGVAQLLADEETDNTTDEAMEAARRLHPRSSPRATLPTLRPHWLPRAKRRRLHPRSLPRAKLWRLHPRSPPRATLPTLRPRWLPRAKLRRLHPRSLPRAKLRRLHRRLPPRATLPTLRPRSFARARRSRNELTEADRSQSQERAKKQGTANTGGQSSRQPQ
jgi:hypothetical protein